VNLPESLRTAVLIDNRYERLAAVQHWLNENIKHIEVSYSRIKDPTIDVTDKSVEIALHHRLGSRLYQDGFGKRTDTKNNVGDQIHKLEAWVVI